MIIIQIYLYYEVQVFERQTRKMDTQFFSAFKTWKIPQRNCRAFQDLASPEHSIGLLCRAMLCE